MMKPFAKIKEFFSHAHNNTVKRRSRITKFICLGLLAFCNIAAITIATLAWFNLNTRESKIAMVSGDLDVDINKVTAYKYVYPYYKKTTEYIDYDSDGVVKQYVIEDHVMKYDGTNIDNISITSDDATVALGESYGGSTNTYYTTNPANASSTKVCIPATVSPAIYEPEFRYYLIGDDKFCGVANSWSITDAYAFASEDDITGDKKTILDDVVIPVGSSFRLLEAALSNTVYEYNYFPITSVTATSAFRVIDDNGDRSGDRLLCLRSGIYKFTYSENQLKIELHKDDSGTRKDISVISNNSLDPTKVTIDYAGGSVNKTNPNVLPYYASIEDYMPVAIYNQNTSLILDVELNFKNANPVEASLQIERTSYDSNDTSINSIFSLANKYADTENNLKGYVNDNEKNMMRASDFYNFYAVFTKTPFAATARLTSTQVLWNYMHRVGDNQCQKFTNVEVDENQNPVFDKTIPSCTLHLKDQNDSIVIPGINPERQDSSAISAMSTEASQSQESVPSSSEALNSSSSNQNEALEGNIYHCYIAIEYDYEHNQYFLNKNRLGKTYLLDRDFGFHFFGIQHKETQA